MSLCEKKSFATKELAKKRVREIESEEKRDKTPIRSYLCSVCGNWHLTSMTKKNFQGIRNKKEQREEYFKEENLRMEAEFWAKRHGWD